jgi:membrane-associated HD superfamily phosphohydrolase
MKTKQVLNKLTYNNHRANFGMLIAIVVIITLIAIKAFSHIEFDIQNTPELDAMLKKGEEIEKKRDTIREDYDSKKEDAKTQAYKNELNAQEQQELENAVTDVDRA